jgi:predicted nucleic acid-binding protein
MPLRFRINDISQFKQRSIFFDANILLYLFWSTNLDWEKTYSSVYNSLIKNNCSMYVDFIVISEVVNRAIRIEYWKHLNINNLNGNRFKYKSYRNSDDGEKAISDVYNLIQEKILCDFQIIGKNFAKKDIIKFLNLNQLDFSDKAIELICRENNFVLLTNDSDFKNSDIDILSENYQLV